MRQTDVNKWRTRLRGLRGKNGLKTGSGKMTIQKFLLIGFFGVLGTHLVYLGELSQLKYTVVKNKTLSYSQFIDEYLHR